MGAWELPVAWPTTLPEAMVIPVGRLVAEASMSGRSVTRSRNWMVATPEGELRIEATSVPVTLELPLAQPTIPSSTKVLQLRPSFMGSSRGTPFLREGERFDIWEYSTSRIPMKQGINFVINIIKEFRANADN